MLSPFAPKVAGVILGGLLLFAAGGLVQAQADRNLVPVLVAAVDIPAGIPIKPEKMVVTKHFTADTAPLDRIVNIEDLRNKTLRRLVYKGEPIRASDFGSHEMIFSPSPPGYRALTLKLDAAAGVSGFVLPGSRVDVVATGVKDGKATARLVLQNVLVLAVSTTSVLLPEAPKDKDTRDNAPLLTFAVKPLDGLKIAEAQALPGSKITLMLRRPGEDDIVPVPGEKP